MWKVLREIGAFAGLAAGAWLVLLNWPRLPLVMASHFELNGTANGFSSRGILWAIVGFMAFIYVVLGLLAQFSKYYRLNVPLDSPARERCEAVASELVGWLKLEIMWLFVVILDTMIRGALDEKLVLGVWFVPSVMGFFVLTIGIYMVRLQRTKGMYAGG